MGDSAAPAADLAEMAHPWWDTRACILLAIVAMTIPLLYPAIPPLVDLPGHLGHYRVELDVRHSPSLQRYFDFHWAPIGNLGVDLLVLVLGPVLGLELAVKLIVLGIPALTAAGFLWVAREVHGRVPPTAFLALPFAYGFPFTFGFVNFALSVALAFVAFGWWLSLGRRGKTGLRAVIFAPLSILVFFCHSYGWVFLCMLCFAAEAIRVRDRQRRAIAEAALSVVVLSLPLVLLLLGPKAGHGEFGSGWFDWDAKWVGLMGILRDRWGPWDVTSVEFVAVIFLFAVVSPKMILSRKLGLAAAIVAAAFILCPRYIFDSAYADVRLLPYLFALALLAVRPSEPTEKLSRYMAVLAIAFLALRLAGTTISFAMAAKDQQAKLAALDEVPRGARVASFYGLPYAEPWALQRDSHLGGLVIARREGFSNDQWITAGHNLLVLKYTQAEGFAANPSQVVRPNGTHDGVYRTIDEALSQVPRDKFDYVWLINPPPFDPRLIGDLRLVWRGPGTALYQVPSSSAPDGQLSGPRYEPRGPLVAGT